MLNISSPPRSQIMYATQASVSWWTWPLHVTLVIIGEYLLTNLVLAVIYINFTKYYGASKNKQESECENERPAKDIYYV